MPFLVNIGCLNRKWKGKKYISKTNESSKMKRRSKNYGHEIVLTAHPKVKEPQKTTATLKTRTIVKEEASLQLLPLPLPSSLLQKFSVLSSSRRGLVARPLTLVPLSITFLEVRSKESGRRRRVSWSKEKA